MLSYYKLKKNENLVLGLFIGVFLLVILQFSIGNNTYLLIFFFIIFLLLYIFMIFSPRFFGILSSTISSMAIVFSFIFLIMFWLLKVNLPVVGLISDGKMLVFVTLLYVFLTNRIIQNNLMIFKRQRIPQLIVDVKNDLTSIDQFTIKNISDFPATNLLITFEIIYPIPDNSYQIIKLWLIRIYELNIARILNAKKTEYLVNYYSEYLESNSSISINIYEEIHKLADEIAIKKEEGLGIIGTKIQVILKYDYKSQDNLEIDAPFFRLFEYEINPTGCHIIHKSGEPVKLI